jgi:hypothetical protein
MEIAAAVFRCDHQLQFGTQPCDPVSISPTFKAAKLNPELYLLKLYSVSKTSLVTEQFWARNV